MNIQLTHDPIVITYMIELSVSVKTSFQTMDSVSKPEVLIPLTAVGAVAIYMNGKISTVSTEMDEMKIHLQGILNSATVSQSEVESMRKLVTQLTQQFNKTNNDIAMLAQSVDRLNRTLGQLGLMDPIGGQHMTQQGYNGMNHTMQTNTINPMGVPQHNQHTGNSINRPYQVNVSTAPQVNQPSQQLSDNSDLMSELGI